MDRVHELVVIGIPIFGIDWERRDLILQFWRGRYVSWNYQMQMSSSWEQILCQALYHDYTSKSTIRKWKLVQEKKKECREIENILIKTELWHANMYEKVCCSNRVRVYDMSSDLEVRFAKIHILKVWGYGSRYGIQLRKTIKVIRIF